MDVVIGIDTGTTATKGVAAGPDGTLRAQTSVHYPLSVPGSGRAELDPHALRNAAVKALIDVAAACRENGDHVVAVGLSAFLHAVVPMDTAGGPLGPLVTWADGRAGKQSEDIKKRLDDAVTQLASIRARLADPAVVARLKAQYQDEQG